MGGAEQADRPGQGVRLTSLRAETVDLLRELIRTDTVNPPGNETAAAELLRDYLAGSGVESELYAREPSRANLVARIPGSDGGPRLALLSHTDTVLADPSEWSVDPWSGELRGDEVWGRGALDMKGQVAASAVALASLAREGFEPAGDLIFVAAADEEVGVDVGLQWLVREHPEAVRAEYALNEGGGNRVVLGGNAFWICSVAEKMSSPFRLLVRGRSGHASMPGIADNALVKAARLIERLASVGPEPRLGPELQAFLRAVLGEVPPAGEAVARVATLDAEAGALLEPLLSLTVSPTIISASEKRNVVPAVCEVTVDCRLLPGQVQAEAEALLRQALGEEDEYELVFTEGHGGTRSAPAGPLWDAVSSFVAERDPEGAVVPYVLAGFTDSHWMRAAFGTVAYGFFPMRAMDASLVARLVHSADERAHVDDLELAVAGFRHAALHVGSLTK